MKIRDYESLIYDKLSSVKTEVSDCFSRVLLDDFGDDVNYLDLIFWPDRFIDCFCVYVYPIEIGDAYNEAHAYNLTSIFIDSIKFHLVDSLDPCDMEEDWREDVFVEVLGLFFSDIYDSIVGDKMVAYLLQKDYLESWDVANRTVISESDKQ